MASEAILWPETSPGELREGATYTSQSEICSVFNLNIFQVTPAENVWPLPSKSVGWYQVMYIIYKKRPLYYKGLN